jgi:hypothetical protein
MTPAEALPDITRSDVGIVAVSQWHATTAADQGASADAAMRRWAQTPAPGLLSVSCFTSTAGASTAGLLRGTEVDQDARRGEPRRVMTYAQWASEQAYRAFVPIKQAHEVGANESAAVADQQPTSAEYRLYRSHRNTIADDTAPGPRIVVITVRSTGKKVGAPFGVAFFGSPVLFTARDRSRQPIIEIEGMPPPFAATTPSLSCDILFRHCRLRRPRRATPPAVDRRCRRGPRG